ncbi:MAG: energy transducer TonB [Glaciimonas sp.]|nr:energy transducer TonB [Glaciimonas sp.]
MSAILSKPASSSTSSPVSLPSRPQRSPAPILPIFSTSAVLQQLKRIAPLSFIIFLHGMLLVAILQNTQTGVVRQVATVMPKEIIATFITSDPKPAPAPIPTIKPKTVPIVPKNITPPRPKPVAVAKPTPIINRAPSEQAIPVPTAAPQQPTQTKEAATETSAAPVAAAQTEPAPTASAAPRTITSGVEYIQAPRPEYPASAKRMGEEGKVTMRVLINEKGRAERIDIQKSSGSQRLDTAAKQALMRALFKPYTEDGKAIPVYAIVPINFQLSN